MLHAASSIRHCSVDMVIFYSLGSLFSKQAEWLSLVPHKNSWRGKAYFMEWLQMPDLFRNFII